MKAATGELNLTVITLIAIAAVMGFFWVMWPNIQNSLNKQWTNISSDDPNARGAAGGAGGMIIIEYNR